MIDSWDVVQLAPDVVLAGKLRLLRPLGHGGMGVVWAARHLALQTDVAVKLIRPERAGEGPSLLRRFEREARATARIAHPHVVKIMDYGSVDGVPFIVMELLRGFSLAELLERGGRLSFATARSLVEQIGGALESAHEQGVVHRDIKPHNVFITEGSKGYPLFVKVLDFGVAKMADSEMGSPSPALTETGVVIGSAPYMSPEQLEGRSDVDLRADLWSLAIIVYEALTGERPFHGGSIVTVGAAVLRGRYRPVTELRPNLPAGIEDWFAKALCVDPDGRFPSAREMVAAFAALESPVSEDVPVIPAGPRAAAGEADRISDAAAAEAYASTVTAPTPVISAEPGGTAGHAPLAKREEGASRRRRRVAAAGMALVAAVAAAGGVSRVIGTSGARGCPAGMKLIEGATFPMGSPEGGETPGDETPVHDVAVAPFCLDVTEVTVAEYLECKSCERPAMSVEIEGLTTNARAFWSDFCNGPAKKDHPQNCVDWHQAKAYCAAAGKRLPTEAEWELAARGTEARTYPWGPAPPGGQRLNVCGPECSRMLTERFEKVGKGPWPAMHDDDDAAPATAPAGRYPSGATAAGVLDLAGNVWEWTESHYCPYSRPECEDSRRVLRGGGWDTVDSQFIRAAHRRPSAPSARGWSIGFRCAKAP